MRSGFVTQVPQPVSDKDRAALPPPRFGGCEHNRAFFGCGECPATTPTKPEALPERPPIQVVEVPEWPTPLLTGLFSALLRGEGQ